MTKINRKNKVRQFVTRAAKRFSNSSLPQFIFNRLSNVMFAVPLFVLLYFFSKYGANAKGLSVKCGNSTLFECPIVVLFSKFADREWYKFLTSNAKALQTELFYVAGGVIALWNSRGSRVIANYIIVAVIPVLSQQVGKTTLNYYACLLYAAAVTLYYAPSRFKPFSAVGFAGYFYLAHLQ